MRSLLISAISLCLTNVLYASIHAIPHRNSRTNYDTLTITIEGLIESPYDDTIVRYPLYEIEDEILKRVVDSFFNCNQRHCAGLYKANTRKYFRNFHGHYVITTIDSNFWNVDSISGIYRDGDRALALYDCNDSILNDFTFIKLADSLDIRFVSPQFMILNEDAFILLDKPYENKSDFRLKFGGVRMPMNLQDSKYYKWLIDEGYMPANSNKNTDEKE